MPAVCSPDNAHRQQTPAVANSTEHEAIGLKLRMDCPKFQQSRSALPGWAMLQVPVRDRSGPWTAAVTDRRGYGGYRRVDGNLK